MSKWIPSGLKIVMAVVFLFGLVFFGAGPPPPGIGIESDLVTMFDGHACSDPGFRAHEAVLLSDTLDLENYLACALDAATAEANSTLEKIGPLTENQTVIAFFTELQCGNIDVRGVWKDGVTFHVGLLETHPSWWEDCPSHNTTNFYFLSIEQNSSISSVDVVVAQKEPLWILDAGILAVLSGVAVGLVARQQWLFQWGTEEE